MHFLRNTLHKNNLKTFFWGGGGREGGGGMCINNVHKLLSVITKLNSSYPVCTITGLQAQIWQINVIYWSHLSVVPIAQTLFNLLKSLLKKCLECLNAQVPWVPKCPWSAQFAFESSLSKKKSATLQEMDWLIVSYRVFKNFSEYKFYITLIIVSFGNKRYINFTTFCQPDVLYFL